MLFTHWINVPLMQPVGIVVQWQLVQFSPKHTLLLIPPPGKQWNDPAPLSKKKHGISHLLLDKWSPTSSAISVLKNNIGDGPHVGCAFLMDEGGCDGPVSRHDQNKKKTHREMSWIVCHFPTSQLCVR